MLNVCVVDKMQAKWSSSSGHVLLYADFIERAAKLGRNVAEAMKKTSTDYMGDDKGICPYCHSNLLLAGTSSVVTCPLCDIRGDLSLEGDEIKINWREEDIKNIRWEPMGMGHHFGEIKKNHAHFDQNKELVKQRLKKYRNYKTYSRP